MKNNETDYSIGVIKMIEERNNPESHKKYPIADDKCIRYEGYNINLFPSKKPYTTFNAEGKPEPKHVIAARTAHIEGLYDMLNDR